MPCIAVCSHADVIDLLQSRGASLSVSDNHNACPVHYAAQMSGTAATNMGSSVSISRADAAAKALETLDVLLGHGVPLDVEDQDQRQPLLWAASSGIVQTPRNHCCYLIYTSCNDSPMNANCMNYHVIVRHVPLNLGGAAISSYINNLILLFYR